MMAANPDELSAEINRIRQHGERQIEDLTAQAEDIVQRMAASIKKLIIRSGFKWCHQCNGTGAIERIDSGYMRRFGLREWNGCKNCGGNGNEQRGRGFYLPGKE